MADIIFVFPPPYNEYVFSSHLGAGYIRSYLQQHSIETNQFMTSQKMPLSDVAAKILSQKPEIIGFTCYDGNYPHVRFLTKMLKKKNPHLTIILGGPTATFSYQTIMEHTPEIDICVRGEGEQTVLELMQKCDDLESIKGITFRSPSGELVSTPKRPFVSGGKKGAELDILPSPYLTGVISPTSRTGILTSRGCVYHCTYCNFSIMFSHTIRYHSLTRVVEELKVIDNHWKSAKNKLIPIHDDIFSLNVKRAKLLCQKIIDEGISLPLSLETRADHCDRELLFLMRDAGVKSINFGLESASLKVLRTIKKCPHKEQQFLDQIRKSVRWAKEAGMTTSVSVIFGLPEEGIKEAKKTLHFVKKLQVDEYLHNVLQICAGTELFNTREKYGLDVHFSPYILPYVTNHAYDVTTIPHLPHARLRSEFSSWKKKYYNALSYHKDWAGNGYGYLLIQQMPDNLGEFCTWLKRISLPSLSCFDYRKGITKRAGAENFALLVQNGVPVGSYCIVTQQEPHLISATPWAEFKLSVPEIPFSQYDLKSHRLFTLEKSQDVTALADFLNTYIDNGILSFSVKDMPGILVNACRWREHACPALFGGVLVIDGNNVLSCYNGKEIGKVGDDLYTLSTVLSRIYNEKKKKRECKSCSAKNECSHCLFLDYFSSNEFCALKRAYPHVSQVITIYEWLSHFCDDDDNTTITVRVDQKAPPLFYHGQLKKGSPLPKLSSNIKLAIIDRKTSAINTEEFKLFSLGSTLAVILEAFQLEVGKEYLISYLCESEHVDTQEAVNALSNAIALSKKKGFLKKE